MTAATALRAGPIPGDARPETFRGEELVESGHRFFGTVSAGWRSPSRRRGGAGASPTATSWARRARAHSSQACATARARSTPATPGNQRVYWQGPSLGFDVGGDGAGTMMLVYNLPSTRALYRRFGGVDGSAYFVGGFGMTALTDGGIVVVPIRSGVGARLGVNVGYLKFTSRRPGTPSEGPVADASPPARTCAKR